MANQPTIRQNAKYSRRNDTHRSCLIPVRTSTSAQLNHRDGLLEPHRLALRIQALTVEERDLQQQITTVLETHAPQLLQRHGIGPDSASALLVTAGDNPDRLHSEASFAALRRQPDRSIIR